MKFKYMLIKHRTANIDYIQNRKDLRIKNKHETFNKKNKKIIFSIVWLHNKFNNSKLIDFSLVNNNNDD